MYTIGSTWPSSWNGLLQQQRTHTHTTRFLCKITHDHQHQINTKHKIRGRIFAFNSIETLQHVYRSEQIVTTKLSSTPTLLFVKWYSCSQAIRQYTYVYIVRSIFSLNTNAMTWKQLTEWQHFVYVFWTWRRSCQRFRMQCGHLFRTNAIRLW